MAVVSKVWGEPPPRGVTSWLEDTGFSGKVM